jgi:hypothetical protein
MLATMGLAAGPKILPGIAAAENTALVSAKADQSTSAPVCLADFEPLAKERLSRFAYEYIASGAVDELTIRWNRKAFDEIRLRPRVLVEVETIDTRIVRAGTSAANLLAPTAHNRLQFSFQVYWICRLFTAVCSYSLNRPIPRSLCGHAFTAQWNSTKRANALSN